MALPTSAKLRGGYYTPYQVADWLAGWAIRSGCDRVLEPSCGDGVFLAAGSRQLAKYPQSLEHGNTPILGIELVPEEAEKARARAGDFADVVAGDFFQWLGKAEPESFDAVIGNPPFIRYQNFPEASRRRAMRFMEWHGLRPNRLTNMWVPFVVAATRMLRLGGRLAMVLPAELLQVSYAAQLRRFLADSFKQITIVACNEMFFERAEQEVVLLAADGKRSRAHEAECRIALVEKETVAQVLRTALLTACNGSRSAKVVQHDTEKWLKYFLTTREIELMRALRCNPNICTLGQHAAVDVGVVTGRNEFFVLSQPEVQEFELEGFVVPLVGRSAHLSGTILQRSEHGELIRDGKRVYLLHLTGREKESFSSGLKQFISFGERKGYHRGYKCSIRDPWYQVPAVWEPDCFFFRQIYDFPRVVVNRAGATSTDTIHRMRCKGDPDVCAANLYTYLTAASAEIEGRSYGGGVLELEPTEAERLLVPRQLNGAMPISEADSLVRCGELSKVLEYNDDVVLRRSIGLSRTDCLALKRIWGKMRNRRMTRPR
jgi:adenine-specific DNA methylase